MRLAHKSVFLKKKVYFLIFIISFLKIQFLLSLDRYTLIFCQHNHISTKKNNKSTYIIITHFTAEIIYHQSSEISEPYNSSNISYDKKKLENDSKTTKKCNRQTSIKKALAIYSFLTSDSIIMKVYLVPVSFSLSSLIC